MTVERQKDRKTDKQTEKQEEIGRQVCNNPYITY